MQKAKYRIRRCTGNRLAWIMLTLRDDGTELYVFGSYWTSMTIDGLFVRGAPLIGAHATIELVWTTS